MSKILILQPPDRVLGGSSEIINVISCLCTDTEHENIFLHDREHSKTLFHVYGANEISEDLKIWLLNWKHHAKWFGNTFPEQVVGIIYMLYLPKDYCNNYRKNEATSAFSTSLQLLQIQLKIHKLYFEYPCIILYVHECEDAPEFNGLFDDSAQVITKIFQYPLDNITNFASDLKSFLGSY